MRRRNGSVFYRRGSWWGRVTFVDPITGKRRDLQRKARTRAEACDIRDRLLYEIDDTGGRSIAFELATFAELADWYERTYLIEPQYVDQRRVVGLRSWKTQRGWLSNLRCHFDQKRIRAITYQDLRTFKAERLRTLSRRRSQRSIASVHRELTLLRRIFNVAVREGWMLRNPFHAGDPLISVADERQRERILTIDEERRLLECCDADRRRHLLPIIICALDTGMRSGELFKLRWRDIDFEKKLITIQAFNTKTMRERRVAMTARILRAMMTMARGDGSDLVFGITDTVKKAWGSVRKAAGLEDVRFHDLRHTAATRLVRGGLPLAEVGRILGHTQPQTTYRYVNADESSAHRAATILDAMSHIDEHTETSATIN